MIALLCSSTVALAACAVLFPDRTAPKNADYAVDTLTTPWVHIPVGADPDSTDSLKADIAYENPKTGSIISINSLCRKYTNSSLEESTTNLVRGINDRQTLRQEKIKVDGADALDSTFSGNVDNVEINIRTVVLIKNHCNFDFIYVVVPKHESAVKDQSFDKFLASFRAN